MCTHESEPVAHDQHARFLAQKVRRLTEDQLHQTWVFFGFFGKLDSLSTRADVCERHRSSFSLRDDLLSDADDVSIDELDVSGAKRVADNRREIVAGLDHRNAGKRGDRKPRVHQ